MSVNSMSLEPINTQSKELLGKLRDLLLEQHKLLLDRERGIYEKANGKVDGPGPFLTLALSDPNFAWLRQVSTLVIEIDEALSPAGVRPGKRRRTLSSRRRVR